MHGTEITDRGASTIGKFLKIRFAEENRARAFQPPRDFSVFSRNAVCEESTGARCLYAGRVDQIFQADGNTMQWPTPVARVDFSFRRASFS